MFVRVFSETAGQETSPDQVTGLGVSTFKGLWSTSGWKVPSEAIFIGYFQRLCCTERSYEWFSVYSAPGHHPLWYSHRRSLMCKVGLLHSVSCWTRWILGLAPVCLCWMDHKRKTVVELYKWLCWLKNWGLVKENITSTCLFSAVQDLSVHQQRFCYLTGSYLLSVSRRTSLSLYSSLPEQTETLVILLALSSPWQDWCNFLLLDENLHWETDLVFVPAINFRNTQR